MKINVTAFIYFQKYFFQEQGSYVVVPFRVNDDENRTFVCEYTFEVDVPDNYDPTAQQIAALEAQKDKAKKECANTIVGIDIRISKLQALEYTA